MKWNEKLRLVRKTKGKTLRDVEVEIGISNSYLSQIETGKIPEPGFFMIHKLLKYYNLSGKDLLMEKPEECCMPGDYTCQVPMPIDGRRQDIDFCITDIVAALNAANIITVASCCGHGKQDGVISLEDGRHLILKKEFIPEARAQQ